MTFTFKLSKRLARLRCLVLLSAVAFAACEKPASNLAGPKQPEAQLAKLVVSPDTIVILPLQSQRFTAYVRPGSRDPELTIRLLDPEGRRVAGASQDTVMPQPPVPIAGPRGTLRDTMQHRRTQSAPTPAGASADWYCPSAPTS